MMLCAVCCTYVVPKLHGEKVDVVCCVIYVVPKLHAEKVDAVCCVCSYCIAYTTSYIVPKLHGEKVGDAVCCALCCDSTHYQHFRHAVLQHARYINVFAMQGMQCVRMQ